MEKLTHDEINLMCIYDTGTRKKLISALTEMCGFLETDEKELRELTNSTIAKLGKLSDAEYANIDLIPGFTDTAENA